MSIRSSLGFAAVGLFVVVAPGAAADKPTDPQIADIAYTAGVIDIKAALQAIAKSKNRGVIEFANDMLRDHQEVKRQALELVKRLNVTPEDNETSKALTRARPRMSAPNLPVCTALPSIRFISTTRSRIAKRSIARCRQC